MRQFNHTVNNEDIIENALTAFLEKHRDKHVETNNENMDFSTHVQVQEKDSNQRIFLTAEESLKRWVTVAENHAKLCKGRLVSKKNNRKRTYTRQQKRYAWICLQWHVTSALHAVC